jgi:hypothetical protein
MTLHVVVVEGEIDIVLFVNVFAGIISPICELGHGSGWLEHWNHFVEATGFHLYYIPLKIATGLRQLRIDRYRTGRVVPHSVLSAPENLGSLVTRGPHKLYQFWAGLFILSRPTTSGHSNPLNKFEFSAASPKDSDPFYIYPLHLTIARSILARDYFCSSLRRRCQYDPLGNSNSAMLSGFISILGMAMMISKDRRRRGVAEPVPFFRNIGGVVTSILVNRTRPLEVFVQVVDILDIVVSAS